MGTVAVQGLRKSFGKVQALDGVTLDVPDGAFFVVLGPSGAGKTTTLRATAGPGKLDAGSGHLAARASPAALSAGARHPSSPPPRRAAENPPSPAGAPPVLLERDRRGRREDVE